ncbi:MAG: cob(I)yrinic acid a,c-diamide adenosyltransferase [Saprospiraceae bacterium]|nr:cob(I)yrinic acid a,c-diamide adenosyltransferase [Saprospiraceae bacterium]
MKIYTKTGDQGSTSLFGGRRISKDDLRIESYGTIDELNSFLGLLASTLEDTGIKADLYKIQSYLFVIGSNLAADPENKNLSVPNIAPEETQFLELKIDQMEEQLKPLRYFILPGGDLQSAYSHVCRTICRRAERRTISLSQIEKINPEIIKYLNRLSDYLFVLARFIAFKNGAEEVYWKP